MSYPKYTKSLLTLRKSKKNHYPELFVSTETVAWMCSVKEEFLKISQNSQENISETPAQMFSCEFFEIFKNTQPRPSASFRYKRGRRKRFLKIALGTRLKSTFFIKHCLVE